MANIAETRDNPFRRHMRRNAKIVAGTSIAGALLFGGIGAVLTASEIQDLNTKIAAHEQTMSQSDMQEFNKGILLDEIMLALTPLALASIVGGTLYTGKIYNDISNIWKAEQPANAK